MPSFLPEPCIIQSRVISKDICNEIIELGYNSTKIDFGMIGGGDDGHEEHRTRKSGVGWLDRNATLSDGKTVFDHITPIVRDVNAESFKFDLNYHESYQFTIYTAPDEHYEWHCDGHFVPYSEEDCKNDNDGKLLACIMV